VPVRPQKSKHVDQTARQIHSINTGGNINVLGNNKQYVTFSSWKKLRADLVQGLLSCSLVSKNSNLKTVILRIVLFGY
jgi:hypothetical protein